MTSHTTFALALSLLKSHKAARKWGNRYRSLAPRWLRGFALMYLCVAVVYLTILWALFASNLAVAARFNGSCGAIVWPC